MTRKKISHFEEGYKKKTDVENGYQMSIRGE